MGHSHNPGRRKLLTGGAALIGSAGAASAGYPIAASFLPSEKTRAMGADVAVDLRDIQPGVMKSVLWRGQAVYILHRTKAMLDIMDSQTHKLKDPDSEKKSQQPEYARNSYRSLKDEYLVVMGVCPHLGCAPRYVPEYGVKEIGDWWKGGFLCPCHNSEFDYAGRVFKGDSPAPMNLPVPPHRYLGDNILIIGDMGEYGD